MNHSRSKPANFSQRGLRPGEGERTLLMRRLHVREFRWSYPGAYRNILGFLISISLGRMLLAPCARTAATIASRSDKNPTVNTVCSTPAVFINVWVMPVPVQHFRWLTDQLDLLVISLNHSPTSEERAQLLRRMKALIDEIDVLNSSSLKLDSRV